VPGHRGGPAASGGAQERLPSEHGGCSRRRWYRSRSGPEAPAVACCFVEPLRIAALGSCSRSLSASLNGALGTLQQLLQLGAGSAATSARGPGNSTCLAARRSICCRPAPLPVNAWAQQNSMCGCKVVHFSYGHLPGKWFVRSGRLRRNPVAIPRRYLLPFGCTASFQSANM